MILDCYNDCFINFIIDRSERVGQTFEIMLNSFFIGCHRLELSLVAKSQTLKLVTVIFFMFMMKITKLRTAKRDGCSLSDEKAFLFSPVADENIPTIYVICMT